MAHLDAAARHTPGTIDVSQSNLGIDIPLADSNTPRPYTPSTTTAPAPLDVARHLENYYARG
jgi:hypothetical protein